MASTGTGVLWTIGGGIASSQAFGLPRVAAQGEFSFVHISYSHIGFGRPANRDVSGASERAVEGVNTLDRAPEFILHTGDFSHNAQADPFDTMDQVLSKARPSQTFFTPGEHDVVGDDGEQYRERYGKNALGRGWQSFDHRGAHFIGPVNVGAKGGLGKLGNDQLAWVAEGLKARSSSTPLVIFAHIPLWTVYPKWNWGTEEAR
jgi:3',5'-cyclic AMP phosphodiesterase CpdA